MTGPGKTCLIYTKYTCSYYDTYLLLCICYPKSVSLLNSSWIFCTYDDNLDTIWITDKKLLHFELSKSGQILRVDKSGFPRPGHICMYRTINDIQRYKERGSKGLDEPPYKPGFIVKIANYISK